MNNVVNSFISLKEYCEKEDFKGWDPYDGLNSKLFNSIPFLKNSAICRLIMIQGFKRNPINLRRLAFIPKEYNAKGIGLFLSGYCNLFEAVKTNPQLGQYIGSLESIEDKIHYLAGILLRLQSKGNYHGACWGYNFDWQARRLFLFPKNTPTIVATTFCATALLSAYEITKDEIYLKTALSSAEFVKTDLNRTPFNGGIILSYSPLKGNDTVFNASLLGSKLLSSCYKYTQDEESRMLAYKSAFACCSAQKDDGSWVYGMLPIQSWVDSFHTGYNLDGLISYQTITGDESFRNNIVKGLNYYIKNFFEPNGIPKYYNNKTYPIDIHCPGQLFVTLSNLGLLSKYKPLAEKVLDWTINNMQDKKGYFYYQLKPDISSKIPYMRWSNAFMFNALSCYLKNLPNE